MLKRNQKGFTLMEMLIVVAIIAVLVAVSIPVFTSQLEKAREATDAANERAAKAVAVTRYLTQDVTYTTGSATLYFDAAAGTLVATKPTTGYGKGTAGGDVATAHTDQVIQAVITESSGAVAITWVAKG